MCILQVGGSALDPDLPEQSNSDGAVVLQLREFKTHLLEAVEELRVWRVELNRIIVQGHIPENAVVSMLTVKRLILITSAWQSVRPSGS